METETLALFEHLSLEFLEEFDVFALAETGRTRDYEPPDLMRGFLHYYKDIYGIRPVERELRNTVVWLNCGLNRPPSRDMRLIAFSPTSNTSLTRRSPDLPSRPPAAACLS
jgi:hypothetical protein